MKDFVRFLFSFFGLTVIKESTFSELSAAQNALISLARWTSTEVPAEMLKYVIENSPKSRSQLQQDLMVGYFYPDHNSERFFVEFGATDGVSLSNTFFLEESLGWRGILCEPARTWRRRLNANRSCIVDYRCVHPLSQTEVMFSETRSPELSTISSFVGLDLHAGARMLNKNYLVPTVSLDDLLKEHHAPKDIHYLSIDTEGSEFDILENFPFENWNISIISIEHNYSENRALLDSLLLAKGFVPILMGTSLFDGWYVCAEVNSRFI